MLPFGRCDWDRRLGNIFRKLPVLQGTVMDCYCLRLWTPTVANLQQRLWLLCHLRFPWYSLLNNCYKFPPLSRVRQSGVEIPLLPLWLPMKVLQGQLPPYQLNLLCSSIVVSATRCSNSKANWYVTCVRTLARSPMPVDSVHIGVLGCTT